MSGGAGEDNAPEVYQGQPGLETIPEPKYSYITTQYGLTQPFQASDRRDRNPFGLGPTAFAALVALLTAIVVGAAVGGGLGGTLASCRANSSK